MENTDRAGVCTSSEVTAQVIKDAALYAILLALSLVPAERKSGLIHDSEPGGCGVLMHEFYLHLDFSTKGTGSTPLLIHF